MLGEITFRNVDIDKSGLDKSGLVTIAHIWSKPRIIVDNLKEETVHFLDHYQGKGGVQPVPSQSSTAIQCSWFKVSKIFSML